MAVHKMHPEGQYIEVVDKAGNIVFSGVADCDEIPF